jgi:hypothetical protein
LERAGGIETCILGALLSILMARNRIISRHQRENHSNRLLPDKISFRRPATIDDSESWCVTRDHGRKFARVD